MPIELAIILIGMPIGFVIAAAARGKWWDEPQCTDNDTYVAVFLTLGGTIVAIACALYGIAAVFYFIFMKLMNSTTNSASKLSTWWKQRQEKKPAKPIRTRIATPVPMVNTVGYRDAAPKPCIACGTPTSLNQDNMEVVLLNEEDKAWERLSVSQ